MAEMRWKIASAIAETKDTRQFIDERLTLNKCEPRLRIVNLPNALTLSRIFIVPLLVVVLLTPLSENLGVPRYFLGVVIFVAAAITDYFDAKIARRRQQVWK